MSEFLSFTVIGIVLGSIYAITATGLVVTYTTTGVFNFAHGAVGMIAAFSFYELWQVWNWPSLAALLFVVLVEAPLLAVAVEYLLMRRLHGASATQSMMVTLGLLVILVGLATALWNPQVPRYVYGFFNGDQFGVLGVNVTYQQLITVIVAVVMAIVMRLFFKYLRIGVALRAVVDDPDLVAMSGARPYRISQMGWMLGFALAALAGCLIAPTVSASGLNITTLTLLVVNGYAAAVLGRLKNLALTFVGAIVLGLATEYATDYLSPHIWSSIAAYLPQLVPVVLLFVALLVVPSLRLASGRVATREAPRVAGWARALTGSGALLLAVVVGAVVLTGTSLLTVTQGLGLGIVALSLVLLTGYAGQISLCQLTFMGIGAFTMARLFGGGTWVGLILGVLCSAAVGLVVALPALRLRGVYLALATLAFGEVAYFAFFNNPSAFPGDGQSLPVARPQFFFWHTVTDGDQLVVGGVFFVLCALGVLGLRRSPFGRRLVAMNDSPAAFATLGLNATVTKMVVFSISAGMAGLGGCLYAVANQPGSIGATDVVFFSSLTLLLFVSIWGVRTVTGALLGGMTAAILPVAESHLPIAWSDLAGLVAGAGIILLSRAPDGVLGWVSQMAAAWRRASGPSTAGAGGGGGVASPGGPGVELADVAG